MKATIQRNKIHLWKEDVVDANGDPTGEQKDILQLGVRFTEYPALPTYGIRVDVTDHINPVDKPAIRAAIKAELLALVDRVGQQMQKDAATRGYFDDWGWADVEFETDNL